MNRKDWEQRLCEEGRRRLSLATSSLPCSWLSKRDWLLTPDFLFPAMVTSDSHPHMNRSASFFLPLTASISASLSAALLFPCLSWLILCCPFKHSSVNHHVYRSFQTKNTHFFIIKTSLLLTPDNSNWVNARNSCFTLICNISAQGWQLSDSKWRLAVQFRTN